MNTNYELIEGCELIEANVIDGSRLEMKFYDQEGDRLLTVKFNKQVWDSDAKKFVADDKKAAQCEEWCQKYFGCSFDDVPEAANMIVYKDVYKYENFNSLWEVDMTDRPAKFTEPVKGIIKTAIEKIVVDQVGIHVQYKYNDKLYESKFATSVWVDKMHRFIPDEEKTKRAMLRFKDTFGVEDPKDESLIGRSIQVQVKKAFNSYYGDILPE